MTINVLRIAAFAALFMAQEQIALAGDFLKSIKGNYIELFSSTTCLNHKYDNLWKSEAAKYVGVANAADAVRKLAGECQGTRTGEDAVAYYRQYGGMQFCCAFMQGVERLSLNGSHITGYDGNGKRLFTHKYHFIETDNNGSRIYESDDRQNDEFRYFWFRPDTPAETHHIEFRYGSDKQQLTQLMEGKYAYWMASGVREGHEEEWQKSIMLFVEENLGAKE